MSSRTTRDGGPNPQEWIEELLARHEGELTRVREVPNMQRGLLRHERRRLARKLGPEHPRVKALADRELAAAQLARETQRLSGLRHVHPCPPREGQIVIEGQVVDEIERPIAGAEVVFTDDQCQRRGGQAATSDDAGYFAFEVPAEGAGKLRGEGLRVAVQDFAGRPIAESAQPIDLEHSRQAVSLRARRIHVRGGDAPPRGKARDPELDRGETPSKPATERREQTREQARQKREREKERAGAREPAPAEGRQQEEAEDRQSANGDRPEPSWRAPSLELINGLGPVRSQTLREHGVHDVRQFLEAEESLLRELLGEIGIEDMKGQARELLARRKP